jgi:hypothetical protein
MGTWWQPSPRRKSELVGPVAGLFGFAHEKEGTTGFAAILIADSNAQVSFGSGMLEGMNEQFLDLAIRGAITRINNLGCELRPLRMGLDGELVDDCDEQRAEHEPLEARSGKQCPFHSVGCGRVVHCLGATSDEPGGHLNGKPGEAGEFGCADARVLRKNANVSFVQQYKFILLFLLLLVFCSVMVIKQLRANDTKHEEIREAFILLNTKGYTNQAQKLYHRLLLDFHRLPDKVLLDDFYRTLLLVDPYTHQPSNLVWNYHWTVSQELEHRSESTLMRALKLADEQ